MKMPSIAKMRAAFEAVPRGKEEAERWAEMAFNNWLAILDELETLRAAVKAERRVERSPKM